jgi:hypothetical protein
VKRRRAIEGFKEKGAHLEKKGASFLGAFMEGASH